MIYFVEDDPNIRELVVYTLNTTEQKAVGFENPSDFWKALDNELPQLILLDVMLPQEDGLKILKKIRSSKLTENIPVIMITAKSSEVDKLKGFDLGADDYVAKPFGMMELLARIKAVLRRSKPTVKKDEYTIGPLYVCPQKHRVRVNGEKVTLTLKEFELLCLMLENRDIVLSRDQILDKIWGYSFDGENRTVDVHIRTLRQKLGDAGSIIETVRGIGYKIGEQQ
ncbi:MAG: response regulator transcription factor [Ruminococcus sp.]|nr:response regulator transcription factor [Ruminococcus sp.]